MRMPKLFRRKKFYLVLAAMLVVAGAASYAGLQYYLKARADGWRRDGIAASRAGDHERAAFLLGGYLRREPHDVEALEFYATSRERAELPNGQHLAETANVLKVLIGIDPTRLDDRRHLLEIYARLDRRPEAIDAADGILYPQGKAGPLRPDPRAMELKTEMQKALIQYREMLVTAEQWGEAVPDDVRAQMAAVDARGKLGQQAEQIRSAVHHEAVAGRLGPTRHHVLLGYAYGKTATTGADFEAAQGYLKQAAAANDMTDDLAKVLAAPLDENGLTGEALAVLQKRADASGAADLRAMVARRLWEAQRWSHAVAALSAAAPSDATADATLVAMKACALAGDGKVAEAAACRAALAARPQAAAKAWALLLNRLIDGGTVDDKALVQLCKAALLAERRNPYLDYYMGDAYARMGEPNLAMPCWRRAIGDNSSWPVPPVRLVEALLQSDQPAEACRVAALTLRGRSNGAAVVMLARAWSAGVEAGAVGASDDLLKLVSEVQQQAPGEDQTFLVQLNLLAQKGQREAAAAKVREAATRTPPPAERTLLAAAMLSRRYDLKLGDECFAASERAHGPTPGLAFARAIDRHLAGKPAEAVQVFDDLAARAGKGDDLYWRLARARFLDAVDPAAATAAWVSLGDAHPDNVVVQQALVGSRALRGDRAALPPAIARLRKIAGEDGLAWRLAQARMVLDAPAGDAEVELASVQLAALVKERPRLAEARVLLAQALVHMKRVDGAIDQLTAASAADPTSVPIALQLAALLQSRGDFERVRQQLDRVAPRLRSPEQRRAAAAMLAQQGKLPDAVDALTGKGRHAAAAPTTAPAEPEPDLFLAILLARQGETAKATEMARKLLAGGADVAKVQFAAGLFASQGKSDEAERALALLDGLRLEPGMKEMVVGAHRGQTGDIQGAAEQFRAAAAKSPGNAAAWRSLAACEALLGGGDAMAAALRQGRAAAAADAGLAALEPLIDLAREAVADESLRRTVAGLITNPQDADAAPDLLRASADAARTRDMHRYAARLQQLVERRRDYLPARVRLVQCLAAMGRVDEAVSAVRDAVAAFRADAEVARAAVQLCAAHERWADVLAAAQQWRQRTVGAEAVAADVWIARASIGLRQFAAAAAQLEPHLAAARAAPDRYADLLTTYATVRVADGHADAAAAVVVPLTQTSGAWRVRCVAVALAVPDNPSAIEWLERVAPLIPEGAPEERVVLAETYDILGRRSNNQALVRKGSDLMAAAAAAPNPPAGVLLAAAAQAERSDQLQVAESLYRRALLADRSLWVAANNLSVLIVKRGGDANEAVRLATSAVTAQPRRAAVHDTLAAAQAKAGDAKGAVASMWSAVNLEPDNATWRIRLAQYLLADGDRLGAAKVLDGIDSGRLNVRDLNEDARRQLDEVRKRVRGA